MEKELKEKIQKAAMVYLRDRSFIVESFDILEIKDTSFISVERYEIAYHGSVLEITVEFDKITEFFLYNLVA